jgi:hypothetical protein
MRRACFIAALAVLMADANGLSLPSLGALPTGSQADILHVPKSLLT